MPHFPFYLASLAWNYGLGMTYVVVPLYALSQGLSGSQIGALFSAPVLAQIVLNLLGGAYTDRLGGRRIMLSSCGIMIAAGIAFALAEGFWMLFAGQLLMVLSRAAFWPATWSIASELPGARGIQLGRLNANTNFGQIVGTGTCGFILVAAGFAATFLVLAAMGLAALAAGAKTPRVAVGKAEEGWSVLAAYRPLLARRIIYYSILCAYLSALPFSLSMSFYPLLLEHYGFAAETSGVLLALRAVGSIGAGLLVARFARTGPATLWPVWSGIAVAVSVGLLPAINHAGPIALLMLTVGFGSGAMTLYFQITLSESSRASERGAALALGGLGWGLSHFSTPLLMGHITDRAGIVYGFYVLGVLALACTAAIALLRRWAFERAPPAGV